MVIWGTPELEARFIKEGLDYELLDPEHPVDFAALRALDERVEGKDYYRVVLTTSPVAMRGFDFRAPSNGINLLICVSSQHERQYLQALFRVGRHGDKCARYLVQGVECIDPEKKADYTTILIKVSEQIQE